MTHLPTLTELFERKMRVPRDKRQKRVRGALTVLRSKPASERKSGHVGQRGGHPARCPHIKVRPAKKLLNLIEYIHRSAGARSEELETAAGNLDDFRGIATQRAAEIAALNLPDNRKAPGYTIDLDLPYDGDAAYRADVARQTAALFEARGYETTWAIHHANERGEFHPHLHLVVLPKGDGTRPIEGGAEMAAFREGFCAIVNETFARTHGRRLPIEFAGGNFASIGIERAPKAEIPAGLYRARERARDAEAAGQPVPVRYAALAAAADRIEARSGTPGQDAVIEPVAELAASGPDQAAAAPAEIQAPQAATEAPQAAQPPREAQQAPAPSPAALEPPRAAPAYLSSLKAAALKRWAQAAPEPPVPHQAPPGPVEAQAAPQPAGAPPGPTSWFEDEGRAYPNRAAAVLLNAISAASKSHPFAVVRDGLDRAAAHAKRLEGVEPETPLAAYVTGIRELADAAKNLANKDKSLSDQDTEQRRALVERVRDLVDVLKPQLERASQIAGEGKVIPPLSVAPGQEEAARLKLSGEPLARLAKLREATIAAFHTAAEQSRQRDDYARGFQLITKLEAERRPPVSSHQTTRIPGKGRGD